MLLFFIKGMIYANFGPATNFGISIRYSSIALGDINSDGDLDLITSGQDNGSLFRLNRYMNKGDGSFSISTNIGPGVYYSSIALGDIDSDSDLDLIVTGWDGATRRLDRYMNNGDGSFTGPISFGIGVNGSSISLGDIDADGDLDLIVTGGSGAGSRLDRYMNNGDGSFTGPISFGIGVNSSSISLGDIDMDGDLDLIVAGSGRLDRYINNSDGNFIGPTNFGSGVGDYCSITLGDIDSDGDLDLIVAGSSRLDRYINNGDGSFIGPISFGTGVSACSIALGDIDSNGHLDLIVTGFDGITSRLDKYMNNGDGNFTGPTNFGIDVNNSSIALGDIDLDNDLDLIVTGRQWLGNRRLDRYRNIISITNNPPNIPAGMSSTNINGYWRFEWDTVIDDHTPTNIIRYKIAYGTNSGEYKISSTNIDFPRGQANIGNVCMITARYFQTKVKAGKYCYWKVCAIDSAFINSSYCSEQTATPTSPNPPQWISIISTSTNQINIFWKDLSNETSYTLYRNITNDTNSAEKVTEIAINITNYNDIVLTADRT